MFFKRLDRHGLLFLIIVREVVNLDAAEIEHLAGFIFLLQIPEQFLIVDFPSPTSI